jgi:hypothetical protein
VTPTLVEESPPPLIVRDCEAVVLAPTVQVIVATPLELVRTVAVEAVAIDPPPVDTVNVTDTPARDTALPN